MMTILSWTLAALAASVFAAMAAAGMYAEAHRLPDQPRRHPRWTWSQRRAARSR